MGLEKHAAPLYNHDLEEKVTERTAALSVAKNELEETIEELLKARDAAEEANRAKSQFSANGAL